MRENTFGYLLSTCNNQLIKLLNRELAKADLDLTREQFVVLNLLWEKDSISQQFLANRLQKDKYSITKLIDGLEKRKLVVRLSSTTDRRLNLIALTPKSMEIRPCVEKVMRDTLKKAFADIPDSDVEFLKVVLEKIIQNINLS